MKIELKQWLNSLKAKDFYFGIFLLSILLFFLVFVIKEKKVKEARIFETKLISACQQKKKVFFRKANDKRVLTLKGLLLDAENDLLEKKDEAVIFLEKESERFEPLFGKTVEMEGVFWSNERGIYYLSEKDLVSFACTGEEIKEPEDLALWMKYFAQNIDGLGATKKSDFSWKAEAFVLKEGVDEYVYVYYSNFESVKNISETEDRVALIKLEDLKNQKWKIVFDSEVDDDGQIVETEKDLFKDQLEVAEYRLNDDNFWTRVQ